MLLTFPWITPTCLAGSSRLLNAVMSLHRCSQGHPCFTPSGTPAAWESQPQKSRAVPPVSRGSRCWLMDRERRQQLCPMAQHRFRQRRGKQVVVLEKYGIGQPPSVSLWLEEVLPSPGALLRPPRQAGTDGSGYLILSSREAKQSRIPSAGKGPEEEPTEAAAAGGRDGIATNANMHLLQLSGEGGRVHHLIWSFEGRFLPPAPHRVLAHINNTLKGGCTSTTMTNRAPSGDGGTSTADTELPIRSTGSCSSQGRGWAPPKPHPAAISLKTQVGLAPTARCFQPSGRWAWGHSSPCACSRHPRATMQGDVSEENTQPVSGGVGSSAGEPVWTSQG